MLWRPLTAIRGLLELRISVGLGGNAKVHAIKCQPGCQFVLILIPACQWASIRSKWPEQDEPERDEPGRDEIDL
jgi:hypothetical protein